MEQGKTLKGSVSIVLHSVHWNIYWPFHLIISAVCSGSWNELFLIPGFLPIDLLLICWYLLIWREKVNDKIKICLQFGELQPLLRVSSFPSYTSSALECEENVIIWVQMAVTQFIVTRLRAGIWHLIYYI